MTLTNICPRYILMGMDERARLTPPEILNWRKKNGYSQITLGKALGVSTITVYRWEKGMRAIPSFLHLALNYLELKGGGTKKVQRKGVSKTNMKGGKKYGKGKA
jgi:DNA-binding XRE family transcriptional regulator